MKHIILVFSLLLSLNASYAQTDSLQKFPEVSVSEGSKIISTRTVSNGKQKYAFFTAGSLRNYYQSFFYTKTQIDNSLGSLTAAVNSKADENHSHNWESVLNKPTLFSGSWLDITDKPTFVTSVSGRTGAVVPTKADVGLSNASNTSDANKPVSTAQAAAIAGKADATHIHTAALNGTVLSTGGSSIDLAPIANVNQTLSLAGTTLSLTNGGSVTLPSGGTSLPAQAGMGGKFLVSDGATAAWANPYLTPTLYSSHAEALAVPGVFHYTILDINGYEQSFYKRQ